MRKTIFLSGILMIISMCIVAIAGNGPPVPNAIWADGTLYATVDTHNNLPPHGPKDGIYAFPNYPQQRAVAESKPGDQDYNGGRWQVYLVNVVHPENLPGELTSWEDVQTYINSGDLEISGMGPSFVCPLIRNR